MVSVAVKVEFNVRFCLLIICTVHCTIFMQIKMPPQVQCSVLYWQQPTAYLTPVRQHVPSNRVFFTSQYLPFTQAVCLPSFQVCHIAVTNSYVQLLLLTTTLTPEVQLMKLCGSQHLEKQTVSLPGCAPILLIVFNLQSSHIHNLPYIRTYV